MRLQQSPRKPMQVLGAGAVHGRQGLTPATPRQPMGELDWTRAIQCIYHGPVVDAALVNSKHSLPIQGAGGGELVGCKLGVGNYLEERLLGQAQAQAPYTRFLQSFAQQTPKHDIGY